jgi:hypothetical protein
MMKSALLVLLGLASSGCVVSYDAVQLIKPANKDTLQVGKAPGPAFEWTLKTNWYSKTPDAPPKIEYTLTVARDPGFGQPVYVGHKIKTTSWQIPPEAGWLPSPADDKAPPFDYHWKVDGRIISDEGEVLQELACLKPRMFSLSARKRVSIEIHAPPGESGGDAMAVQLVTKVGNNPESTGSVTFDMEVGETRAITIQLLRQGKEPLKATGDISVLTTTENMKHGTVIIENLNAEKLEEIQKGTVVDLGYRLGGDEIVKLKLGSR